MQTCIVEAVDAACCTILPATLLRFYAAMIGIIPSFSLADILLGRGGLCEMSYKQINKMSNIQWLVKEAGSRPPITM